MCCMITKKAKIKGFFNIFLQPFELLRSKKKLCFGFDFPKLYFFQILEQYVSYSLAHSKNNRSGGKISGFVNRNFLFSLFKVCFAQFPKTCFSMIDIVPQNMKQ